MATPAQTTILTPGSAGAPAEPVPVAFLGRTSTLEMQDPRASLRRQLRSSQAWLPPGWFIAAVFCDVESGGRHRPGPARPGRRVAGTDGRRAAA